MSESRSRVGRAARAGEITARLARWRAGERDPQAERLVELRFFAGLSLEESAVALERSEASLGRDSALARAVLFRELRPARAAV